MSHPLVINIHAGKHFDVYVGRPGKGRNGFWGNAYEVGKHGSRAECIAAYRHDLERDPVRLARLPELRGKVLGCFCAPNPCHGDVLAAMANKADDAGQAGLFGEGGAA